jgi:Zn finger protein HypA/HybF involved in hydrogenase expression
VFVLVSLAGTGILPDNKLGGSSSESKNGRTPVIRDSTGYVLTKEEVQKELEYYQKAMPSFLCRHCRGFLRTASYVEFVRRRATQVQGVPLHGDLLSRLILEERSVEDWRRQVNKLFDICPLCDSMALDIDVQFGRRYDEATCVSCKAKWQIDWKGENYEIDSVSLVQDSIDKKGGSLLWKELNLEFWKRLASNPDKRVSIDEIRKEEKARLKEEVETWKVRRRNALVYSILLIPSGLFLLVFFFSINLSISFFGVLVLLIGGMKVRGFITLRKPPALKRLDELSKQMKRMITRSEKKEERLDRILLVECPKCKNKYGKVKIGRAHV